MNANSLSFLILNLAHFYNHFLMLVFSTVAALALTEQWGISYAELIPYSVPGLLAYGFCTIPAGWIADKWNREKMICIFFIGSGISAVATSLCDTPIQLAMGLFLLGVFSAIYHPVGLAMVAAKPEKMGVMLAVNGIFGNLGVAAAAIVTGYLIDYLNWQSAFMLPGLVSIVTGVFYLVIIRSGCYRSDRAGQVAVQQANNAEGIHYSQPNRDLMIKIFLIILVISAVGGLLFQSTTFALPKIFQERLRNFAESSSDIGEYVFLVFFVASFAQLIAGFLIDRFRTRLIFSVVVGLQIVALLGLRNMEGLPVVYLSMILMLGIFAQIPIVDTIVGRIAKPQWRSRAYAIRNVCSFLAAPLSVSFIAFVHLEWGFSILFSMLSFVAMVSFVAIFLIPEKEIEIAAASPR